MSSPTPSEWAKNEARRMYLHGRCACDLAGICALHLDIAEALDAAELRGFQRAVDSTALHSIHKAVAAERAAVVAWLRTEGPGSPADVWGDAFAGSEWTTAADFIEAGAHRKEQA